MSPLLGLPSRGAIPARILRSIYPLSYALGLRPVSVAGNEHEGFDIDEVAAALGNERFAQLEKGLTQVFCCGHRCWPADHAEKHKRSAEVHCIYAYDLEAFLQDSKMQ